MKMNSERSDVVRHFTSDELEVLDSCRYNYADGRSTGVVDLIVAWMLHVDKIDADRSAALDDPKTWGPYDLIAAMTMRKFVERCIEQLPDTLGAKVMSVVSVPDDHFRAITQPDTDDLVLRFEDDVAGETAWWWHRIPDSGPILMELRGSG